MSVAPTHTQISEHPGKMGVTSAASGKELEADVQRKMKLWGVIEAFRDGRLPDNHQIDKALEYAVGHSPVELNKLSPEGRVLVDDFRDIIETLRTMVYEKNADELFQNAVYSSYGGDASRGKQSGVVPVSKEDAKADGQQAAAHLRVLITLFVTNSEARKLLNDFGIVGRDIFATGAAKAADKARPTQDQLDRVDQEAPSHQWIGADGKKLGPNDTPDVQVKGPDGSQVRYNPKDDPRDAKVVDTDGNARSAGQAYDEAQQKKAEAQNKKEELKNEARQEANAHGGKEGLKEKAKSHAQDVAGARDPNASYSEQKDQIAGRANQKANEADQNTRDVDRDQAKDQARGKVNDLKNKIPDEHRERAANAVQDTKNFLKEQLPEERRDQFIYRLKKVVVECQGHKDYQEAMSWLLDTLENYQGHAKHVARKGTESAQAVADDPNVGDSTLKFRTLLERFANNRPLDGVIDALDQIYSDVQNDSELRNWFTRLNDYAHRALLEPGYILDEDSDREATQLKDSGKSFFQDKYKGHQEHLFDELQSWFVSFNDDPLNRRLGEDIKRLAKDLLFNENGDFQFKPKLWGDIRTTLLPAFISQVGYIPIPRAEYSDDKIDIVVENLILSGPNLFPNVILIEAHNSFKFSPYPGVNRTLDTHHHKFRAGLSQIQADIRDVAFAFRRKSGWPKISDHGLADVVIAGKGISVDVELETVEGRRDSVFKVNHVNVEIDTLKFSLRDTKHDLLYKFVKATATGLIKKAITVAVQQAMRISLEHLDDQLVEVRNRVDEAKQSDETTRTQALKDLYGRKKATAQEKAHEADAKTGTFKIVTNRESQLNPDLTHSAEKSTAKRLFKVQDLANTGKEWRSPAFDLLDNKHPAVTGHHHPSAVQGAGSAHAQTSAVQNARA
ncbi:hypothetical protein CI109_103456 [Kwoniella shandongensis]|uniref:Uncharacterized protein n=1 Tax=Kwoniella shandongensis TaxID=1734106 RepID=A0A5M6C0H3_9TREE|nr:uncharacterized protein CI109_004641 [Kwoniella shandongensis]KAA5527105.1 hypothetical protein CI109_004641 [Kwoniella shandongensis]